MSKQLICATELANRVGINVNTLVSTRELVQIQTKLSDYQIIVIDARNRKNFIFIGPR